VDDAFGLVGRGVDKLIRPTPHTWPIGLYRETAHLHPAPSAAQPTNIQLLSLPWLCLAVEMFRSPAAALLRRLAPRLSGGTVGAGSSTRRNIPPHIAPSFFARFSSTPTSSPPPSSVGARDDEEEDDELQGAPVNEGAKLSISVDRSGLYSPPGRTPLTRTHTQIRTRLFVLSTGSLMVQVLFMRQSTRTSRRRTLSLSSTSRAS
jgi:hypothetical protein